MGGTDLALGKEEGRLEKGLLEGPFLDVAAAMESIRTNHLIQLRRRPII
jgi:hypothetical protein